MPPGDTGAAQSRRELLVAVLLLLFIITSLMLLVGLPLWNQVAVRFGGVAWIVFPLLALVASLGLMAAFVVVLSVYAIIRNLRLRFEKPSLALARKSAGEDGTIERSGPVTTWWCGTTDPVPTLMEQMGISHERFERLIDESVETPPLRVLVFDTRSALGRLPPGLAGRYGGV